MPEQQARLLSSIPQALIQNPISEPITLDDDFQPTQSERPVSVMNPSFIEQHYFSLNLKPMHLASSEEYTLPLGQTRALAHLSDNTRQQTNQASEEGEAPLSEHKIALQHQSFRAVGSPPPPQLIRSQQISASHSDTKRQQPEVPQYINPSAQSMDDPHSKVARTSFTEEDSWDNMIENEQTHLTVSNFDKGDSAPLSDKKERTQPPITALPALDLLSLPNGTFEPIDEQYLQQMAEKIEQTLADYRVKVEVVDFFQGPVITLYELQLAAGVKASRISALSKDLARALSVTAVRVVEVIPGKPYVGLELPNVKRQSVFMRELLADPIFEHSASKLTLVLGKDIAGQAVIADLAKMPHLLVAGTTGSGKSVGVNAMIISMLYKAKPDEVRFIMIDPKMLELSVYEGIPHLLTEVVTDMKDAANALYWCVEEMERRYKLMSALGVRNIAGYNQRIQEATQPIPDPFWKPQESFASEAPALTVLPAIVVIVDEFADLIMAVGKKVEELIARLAQKARAAGIHLILATQRPSVDVITGLIKANVPTRIAFTVSSKIDSRTILDQSGAESLLGMGDMLYLAQGSSIPTRVHGAFVKDEEVHAVVQDWKLRQAPQYIEEILAARNESGAVSDGEGNSDELDPLFDETVAFIIDRKRVSISSVQRQFRIGYNRAARIVEQMEQQGIISEPSHNGTRDILARLHDEY